LLYSSKTYYQEEIYKREKTNKNLSDRVIQLERKQKLLQNQKKISAQMANKLMQDVDEIDSSDDESSMMPDLSSERVKKDEIIANLKHLNLLGNHGNAPSSDADNHVVSPMSNPAPSDDKSFINSDNTPGLKEPSISDSEEEDKHRVETQSSGMVKKNK